MRRGCETFQLYYSVVISLGNKIVICQHYFDLEFYFSQTKIVEIGCSIGLEANLLFSTNFYPKNILYMNKIRNNLSQIRLKSKNVP